MPVLHNLTGHHLHDISPAIPLLQQAPSLLLWCLSSPQAGISPILSKSVGHVCAWCVCLGYSSVTYSGLLCPHHLCHSKNPILCWKIQGFLYLCLPSHCGNCSLWLCLFHLLKAQIQLLFKSRHPNICIYTILTPLFNPMIYSLRNKEFKSSLQEQWPILHILLIKEPNFSYSVSCRPFMCQVICVLSHFSQV